MKKFVIICLVVISLLQLATAIDVEIQRNQTIAPLISDTNLPAEFKVTYINHGETSTFELYNLIGLIIEPNKITLNKNEPKEVTLKLSPIEQLQVLGNYKIHYFLRANDGTEARDNLTFKVTPLKETLELEQITVNHEAEKIQIAITNKEKIQLEDIQATFISPFFKHTEKFTLGPHERKEIQVEIDKEEFKKLTAGFYTVNAEIKVAGAQTTLEGTITFKENDTIKRTITTKGFIIRTYEEKDENVGNLKTTIETTVKKNILSRLFTTFNNEPDQVERKGVNVYYTWTKTLEPSEKYTLKVRTNWLFPVIIIAFIIIIVTLAKQLARTDMIIRKQVSFVKAKGGEFGLRITVSVQAKKFVEKINIIEKVPLLAKVYNRFDGLHPTAIKLDKRRIEWEIPCLEPGERRTFSYMIYSKVGILGKFALPKTRAFYEKEGKTHEAESNRAFFIAEQKKKDDAMEY